MMGQSGVLQPAPSTQTPYSTHSLGGHQAWAGVCAVASSNRPSARHDRRSSATLRTTRSQYT